MSKKVPLLGLMYRRIVVILSSFFLSFFILFVSIVNSASAVEIDYTLPYPGNILPDNPLWFIKALRDKAWVLITSDPIAKSKLKLLFADKRLTSSKILFEKEKFDLGVSTLTKAEKYLEEAASEEAYARSKGIDTSRLLMEIAKASLKHRQIADEILGISPEGIRPTVIHVQDYSKNVYKDARDTLLSKGIEAPQSPFHD